MITFWSCFLLTKQPGTLIKREPGCCIYKDTKMLGEWQAHPTQPSPKERALKKSFKISPSGGDLEGVKKTHHQTH